MEVREAARSARFLGVNLRPACWRGSVEYVGVVAYSVKWNVVPGPSFGTAPGVPLDYWTDARARTDGAIDVAASRAVIC